MVSLNTFSWRSLRELRSNPLPSSVVMLATVAVVVATRDLAIGVLTGVLLSGVFFAGKVSRMSRVVSELSADGRTRTYRVSGQVFFASAGTFAESVEAREPIERLVIDVHAAHFWDISAVDALDRVVMKARAAGRTVEVIGLNEASATLVERFGRHDKAEASLPVH